MTSRMQGMLLRFLETGELQKVGSDRPCARVDVRVVAATNRDLRGMLAEGHFREDLFYRLNVIHLVVPPLRERRQDIRCLTEHFLQRFASRGGSSVRGFTDEAMQALCDYAWPGNVRELENVIERVVVNVKQEIAELSSLPVEVQTGGQLALRPKRERRRSIADELYRRLREDHESFWTSVYPLYMRRDITRDNVREIVRRGLEDARGNYRLVARLFNLAPADYRRFLGFLRKHECQLPFKEYRQ
jgi:DNA-binding NtrC family response regulator